MENHQRVELINNIKSNLTRLYDNCCVNLQQGCNEINVLLNGKPLDTNKNLIEFKCALDELSNNNANSKKKLQKGSCRASK